MKKRILTQAHIIVTLLCAVIILLSNYLPEAVGPANNGDFLRVMHPNKIEFLDGNPRTMWRSYGYTPQFVMRLGSGEILSRAVYFIQTDFSRFDFPSSQILTIKLSKILNLGFNIISGTPAGTYNLFWLFIIHLAVFSTAIYLILGYILRRFGMKAFIISSLIAVFVLSDHGYSLYFNSFYGEALQYVMTLLVIGLLLRLDEGKKGLLIYYIAVYLMATAKFAWIPVGIFFALAPLAFLLVKDITYPKKKLAAYSAVTVCALLAFYSFLIPSWIERDTNFNSVFNGVLRNSQTPEQDLIMLGLDPALAILQGYEMYMESYPIDIYSEEFNQAFFEVISKPRILMFYLRHPARFFSILQESAGYARFIRAPYLTSVQNPEYPGQQAYRFSLWEQLRIRLSPLTNFFFIVFILSLAAILSMVEFCKICKSKHSSMSLIHPVLLFTLSASAAVSFVIPYLSNGVADQAKQLFGFISLFDIILFTLLACFLCKISGESFRLQCRKLYDILAKTAVVTSCNRSCKCREEHGI